jgi:hypothetical protein
MTAAEQRSSVSQLRDPVCETGHVALHGMCIRIGYDASAPRSK